MKRKTTRLARTARGAYILPNGDKIYPYEVKELRRVVATANRKRKKMLEELPEMRKRQYEQLGIESDFIYRKKSARINRFRNKREFNEYLKSVRRLASGRYMIQQNRTYFENYKQALYEAFNSQALKLVKLMNKLGVDNFANAYRNGYIEDIGYIYSPEEQFYKLNKIESQLNWCIEHYGKKA